MTQPASPFLDQQPPAAPPPPVPMVDVAPAQGEAPPAPEPAPLVGVSATNQLEPEQLTEAYKLGRLQFRAGERVPVRLVSGKIGTVPAEGAAAVVNGGGEIIPHAVVEHERLSREYGGTGGTFAAGLAGAARGATVGLSDPLAIAAAELTGGREGADKMRERLVAYKELSPIASAVGEVAGMVAPALLTGGESAVARGVGLAAAAPLEATSALGRLAERGVAAALPELGESLAARAATKAVTGGARGAIEGAIFAGGQEISEASLGNEQLTGEKLLASMGHGAVVGGLLGGALGGAGEVASDLVDAARAKASPYLAKQAGVQAWRALDPLKKYTKEAEARFEGGSAGVGRTLLDLDVIPKDASLTGAALTPEELLPRVEERLSEQGKKIGSLLDDSAATVKLGDLNDQIEEVLAPLRAKAGFKPIVKAVEAYRDDLFDRLGASANEAEVAAGAAKPLLEIPAHLEPQRAQIEKLAEAAARGEAEAMQVLDAMGVKRVAADEAAPDLLAREVPVSSLFAQKRALGDLVYNEVKALDPSMRVEQLRAIYGRMSEMELDAVGRAAKGIEGAGRAELLAARKNYQALSIAKKALDETSARMATNRNLGLSEYLTAGMAASSGHLLAAPVVAVAHRVARARGNAFLAATFDRLSALQTMARRNAEVDAQIGTGVKAFLGRAKGTEAKSLPRTGQAVSATGTETAREEYARRVADLQSAEGEDHGPVVMALAAHAPKASTRFRDAAQAATSWLAMQVPKPPPIGSRTPSDQDVHRFLLQARSVDDPVGTITRGLASGTLSPIETHAIRDCGAYPALMQDIQQRLHAEAARTFAAHGAQIPYGVRRDLALLFDAPEWSMSPEGIKMLQSNTQIGGSNNKSGPQGGPGPKRPMPSHPEYSEPETDRLAVGQIR